MAGPADAASRNAPFAFRRSGPPRLARLALCAASMAIAASGAQAQSGSPESLRIAGSNTVGAELFPNLVNAFIADQGWSVEPGPEPESDARLTLRAIEEGAPQLRIDIERLGSSTAFTALADGSAEIGMASRPIKDAERVAFEGEGGAMRSEDSEHVIALDGLVVAVSPENPITTLTRREIAAVFSGEVEDWSAFGLPPAAITVQARDDQSGTWDTFSSLALEPFGASLADRATRHASNREMARRLAADPAAIGFVPLASANEVKPLAVALECGLVIAPDAFSVKAEEYPFSRRLYLYTKGAPPPGSTAAALLAFAKSDAAQPVVAAAGFVEQTPIAQGRAALSDHIVGAMAFAESAAERAAVRRLVELSAQYDRLSITFRFAAGSDDLLDAKSLADAARLARWIAARPERDVLLLGFGDADATRSQIRAEASLRAVLINASDRSMAARLRAEGVGRVAPVVCAPNGAGGEAGDAAAQDRNQRVEVWVSR